MKKWKTCKNAKNTKITEKQYIQNFFFLQNRKKTKMEKIAFCAITFDPIKIQTHSAPQNDRLNFSFVKDSGNLAWNSCKTAICRALFFSPPSIWTNPHLSKPIQIYLNLYYPGSDSLPSPEKNLWLHPWVSDELHKSPIMRHESKLHKNASQLQP